MNLQLRDIPVLHILTDLVGKIEDEMDSSLTTVTAELKSEMFCLETRLTDLRKTTGTRLITQGREIGSLTEELVTLIHRVVKI